MIERKAIERVRTLLGFFPAVGILGPRQVGKTTMARELSEGRPSLYLDLENPDTRAVLAAGGRSYLERHLDKLVVLDEVQRAPEVFAILRGLIDQARRMDGGTGRYLVLGSASNELLRQSSESLAGRIGHVDLPGVLANEVGGTDALWLRGGFPDSLLAQSDPLSLLWRQEFIRTYLERDIPALGPRIPAETLGRFWTMLAHLQGCVFNGARIAAGLGVSGSTVGRYLDVMVDLMLVRRLMPWTGNVSKRLTKSPKVYVRDSGLVHALLKINGIDDLLGHPVVGASWEGFVVEQILSQPGIGRTATFFRSAAGEEVDLVFNVGAKVIAVEIRRSLSPAVDASFHKACDLVGADVRYVVYPGQDAFELNGQVRVRSVQDILSELRQSDDYLHLRLDRPT